MNEIRLISVLDSLRELERRVTLVLLETGLSLSQLRLLRLIAEADTVSASDLSRHLAITKASVSGQVQDLQKLGLIEVRANPDDKRGRLIAATEAGRFRLSAALENVTQLERVLGRDVLAPLARAAGDLDQILNHNKEA